MPFSKFILEIGHDTLLLEIGLNISLPFTDIFQCQSWAQYPNWTRVMSEYPSVSEVA